MGSWVGEGGKYSFALISASTDTMVVASRENATVANRPTLILNTYESGEGSRLFFATEDSTVDSSAPSTNFGTATTLSAQTGATTKQAYVKFLVADTNTTATKAYLRLYVTDATVNAPAVYVTSTSWSESTINWNNRPQPIGNPVANVVGAASGDYFEYDVSSAVTVDATYAFVIIPESTDTLVVASTEAAQFNRPELVLVGGALPWCFRCECGTNGLDQHCCLDKTASCASRWTEVATDPFPKYNYAGNCKTSTGSPVPDWSFVAPNPVPTAQKDILVIAIHGGSNEPGTSVLAAEMAARSSLDHWRQDAQPSAACKAGDCKVIIPGELWQCIVYRPHDAAHVEGDKYIQADLMARLPWYRTVISLHGFKRGADNKICVGGNSATMRQAFIDSWNASASGSSFEAIDATPGPSPPPECTALNGEGDNNPVNMGSEYDSVNNLHGGLQLEMARSLRDILVDPTHTFYSQRHADFYAAIDSVILTVSTVGP